MTISKRYLTLLLLLAAVLACSTTGFNNPSPFSKKDVSDSINVAIEKHMFPGAYYRVKFDTVNAKFENLAYMGTREGMHYFSVYSKAGTPEFVYRVALTDSQCKVYDQRTFDLEFMRYHNSFRNAIDWKGKCIVFGDSTVMRFRNNYEGGYSNKQWYERWEQAISGTELGN